MGLVKNRGLWWLAVLVAAGGLSARLASTPLLAPLPNGGPKNMLSYDAAPLKTDYLLHEAIRLRLRVENHGPDPLELPDPQHAASDQPTFGLLGPAFPEGKLFNNLTALREASGDPKFAPPVPPPRIRIEPGATWEGFTDLTETVEVAEPGEYRVWSTLEYQGARTDSKETSFHVHPLGPSCVHLGMGVRPFQVASGEVVFIQGGKDSAEVYAFRFDEKRPDISEMHTEQPIPRARVSANACDVAKPWKNAPFFNELLGWIVWREGLTIKALSDVMSKPLSLELSAEPAYLVHPPLKTTGGAVEILAVSSDRQEISLIEFSSGPVGQNPAARVVWKSRLPGVPSVITAALAPESQQSARHVAMVVQHESGFEILHSRYTEAGGLEPFQSIKVEKGRLLANAEAALFADATGHAKVGVLAVPDESAHSCTLVEAEFDGSGKPVGDVKFSDFKLEGRPTTGTVLYSQNEGAPIRLDVVIAVEGVGLLHLDHSGHMIPVAVEGTPTSPILLAPGRHVTYVLYADPNRGLYFEAL
jgi:hypothetical protein